MSKHYEITTTKAYQTLGVVHRTFKQIPGYARKQLYIAIVLHFGNLNYWKIFYLRESSAKNHQVTTTKWLCSYIIL